MAAWQNSLDGEYAKKFKRGYRETFKVGDKVRVAKSENLVGKPKEWKGRFVEMGIVKVQMLGDFYSVKMASGKLVMKRHFTLKLALNSW